MRAERLLSFMLLLHSKGRMTAQELAQQLVVSERTIYRDIEALCTAGIPLYTQSGVNGGVFLEENYRVSLTGLSKTEVQSLFISGDARPLGDLGLGKALDDTLLKLFAALPSIHRDEVKRLRQRFYIDAANWFQIIEMTSFFPLLQQAVWEDRQITISYQPVEKGQTEYTLDAYALVAKANVWYLVGRKPGGQTRNYRISRFKQLALTDSHFERDLNFDLAAYWKTSCEFFEKRSAEMFPPYPAMVRIHPKAFWYFPGYMNGRYEEIGAPDGNGWLTLRVVFESLGDARMRLLGLGADVQVLEPTELHNTVIEMARAIVACYTDDN